MRQLVLFIVVCMLNFSIVHAQHVLRLYPANRHYLMYRNKPVILITSGEHYGALLNLDFDYISYPDALQKEGNK